MRIICIYLFFLLSLVGCSNITTLNNKGETITGETHYFTEKELSKLPLVTLTDSEVAKLKLNNGNQIPVEANNKVPPLNDKDDTFKLFNNPFFSSEEDFFEYVDDILMDNEDALFVRYKTAWGEIQNNRNNPRRDPEAQRCITLMYSLKCETGL